MHLASANHSPMDFLGKLKGKVSDASQKLREGVDHVVSEAGEKLLETRIRAALRALQTERQARLLELGSRVFELHRGDGIGPDDLSAELAALDQLELDIASKQLELDHFLGPSRAVSEP